jgi:diguanylate cyclase (GGDEF)-like protein
VVTKKEILKILICDDDSQDRKLIRHYINLISDRNIVVLEAERTHEIQAALEKGRIDLVLLDLQMPEKTGMQWLRDIVERQLAPVVILTGHGDEEAAIASFQNGAVDYLPKANLSPERLNQTIKDAINKWEKELLLRIDKEQLEGLIGADVLTGTLNRRAIMTKLDDEIVQARRYGMEFSLIMLDIDYFKKVNDNYGHLVGDDVLEKIGSILIKRIRETDAVGRYGGEEFLIVLPNTILDTALTAASRIRRTIMNARFRDTKGHPFKVTASQGLTSYVSGDTKRSIIERADRALLIAKNAGRNRVRIDQFVISYT